MTSSGPNRPTPIDDALGQSRRRFRSTRRFAEALAACAADRSTSAIALSPLGVSGPTPPPKRERAARRADARARAEAFAASIADLEPSATSLVALTDDGEPLALTLAPATTVDALAALIRGASGDRQAVEPLVGRAPRSPTLASALPAFAEALLASVRAGVLRPDAASIERALDEATIAAEFKRALRGEQARLVFEPIVRLADGRVWALSAQARWSSPSRGPVSPQRIAAIAERIERGGALARWSAREAFGSLGPLLRERRDLAVVIEVSALGFDGARARAIVEAALEVGGEPSQLIVELRECRSIEDEAALTEGVAAARAAGARVLIGDVVGPASWAASLVGACKVDGLKIHPSLAKTPRANAGPAAALALAEALRIEVIAGDVEDEEALAALRGTGVGSACGALFSRAEPASTVAAAIRAIEGATSEPFACEIDEEGFDAARGLALLGAARWRYSPHAGAIWLDAEAAPALGARGRPGSDLMAAIAPESRPLLRARLDRALAKGRPSSFEAIAEGRDEAPVWLAFHCAAPAPGASTLVGVVEDVTRVAAMRRQIEVSSRAERILDCLPDAIALEDRRGRILYANDAARSAIADRGPAAEAASSVVEAFGFANAESARAEARAVAESARPRDGVRLAALSAEGGGEWRWVHLAPALEETGRAVGVVTVMRDAPVIAAPSREEGREASTKAANALLERLLETLDEPLFAKDAAGRYLVANAATAEGLGVDSIDALLGRTDFELLPPEIAEQLRFDERQAMELGERCVFGQSITDRDGRTRWHSAVLTPMSGADGRPIGVIGHRRTLTTIEGIEIDLAESSTESRLYRAMLDALPDMVFYKDLDGRFLAANRAMAEAMGASSPAAILGRTERDLIDPGIAARLRADEAAFSTEGRTAVFEQPCLRPDGSRGWLRSLKSPVRDRAGRMIGYVGHNRDVTDERRAHAASRKSETLLAETLEALDEGIALFDANEQLMIANSAFCRAYGLEFDAMRLWSAEKIVRMAAASNAEDAAAQERWTHARLRRFRAADARPSEVRIGPRHYLARDVRTRSGHIATLRSDITELKLAEAELRRMAVTDVLTGVPNRRCFDERARARLASRAAERRPSALLMIDVDHFKAINDRFGHGRGDAALIEVAHAMRDALSPRDLFARWGGEEFVALLDDVGQKEAFERADRIRRRIARATERDSPSLTVSIGVAVARGGDFEAALRAADAALYAAKADGRNCVRLASPEVLLD